MNPVYLALLAALLFGISATFVKAAVNRKPSPLNSVITFAVASIVTWIPVIMYDSRIPSAGAMPYLVAAGILAPGLSALFNFESIKRVGVGYATPIMAASPIFATTSAMIAIGERINLFIGLGTILIITGVIFLTYFRPRKHVQITDLLLPLSGAILVGIATTISKIGLTISDVPFGGIAIAITAGAITQMLIVTARNSWSQVTFAFHDFKYFALAGLVAGIGLSIFFYALSLGNVSVVFPINSLQTLFSVLLAWIFIRKNEYVGIISIIGACTVLVGAGLIAIGA